MDAPLWVENAGILDLVHDSIIVRDMNGRIVQWNSAAEALYGWTREEAVGRNLHDLLSCGDPALLPAVEARLLAEGGWEGELCRTTRDGAETWIDLRWSLQRDSEGRPTCIVETGRDVTARRAAEEAARLTEYRYRNLFQAMSVAFFEVDFAGVGALLIPLRQAGVDLREHLAAHPERVREAMRLARVVDVNDKALALFGAGSRDEIVGGSVEPYWPDESLSVFGEALVETFEKKPHLITETRLRDLRGGPLDVLFTVSWSPESRRRGILLIGIIDVSDRRRASAALAQSELKYRNLFQHMPISLWQIDTHELMAVLVRLRREGVTDLDAYMDSHPDFLPEMMQLMRVEQVNDRTVRLFGGQSPSQFVGPIAPYWQDSLGTLRRSLVARFAGAESYAEETQVRGLDGRKLDVFYTSAFPAALSEMGIGLVGAIDIGDRIEAERKLRQVQADFAHAARVATLGELTAGIAHEVNQPLAAIVTNGEASLRWLAREAPDVEEVRTLAARMVADARRAADIIAHIRAMATRQAPVPARVDVNALVGDSLGFLRHELTANGIAVSPALAAGLPPVCVDRTQIQQVLVNLAVNAVQAMAQAGIAEPRMVLRTAAVEGDRVRIEVEDNGPGIDSDRAARLFDSFFTTKPGGLGIGLSLSRSIVEAHGGEIGFVDTGGGACFSFTLPAAGSYEGIGPLSPT